MTLIKQRGLNLVASRQSRGHAWFPTVTARQQSLFVPWRFKLFVELSPVNRRFGSCLAGSIEIKFRFKPRRKVIGVPATLAPLEGLGRSG
jgi:hypothetical protein